MPVKPAPWTVESSRIEYGDRFLRHRIDRCLTERGNVLDPYHVLELNDWCMVAALNPDGDLILVEEYRHGAGLVVRGLPAGTVEPGEDPAVAMPRELGEETGHIGGDWYTLPTFWSNPATSTNLCHAYLAVGVTPDGVQRLDPGETIDVLTRNPEDAMAEIASGAWLTAGLQLTTLLLARDHARKHLSGDPRVARLIAG